jgi:hypothetical protein
MVSYQVVIAFCVFLLAKFLSKQIFKKVILEFSIAISEGSGKKIIKLNHKICILGFQCVAKI